MPAQAPDPGRYVATDPALERERQAEIWRDWETGRISTDRAGELLRESSRRVAEADLHAHDPAREVVSVGLDGASRPMLRYRDELHLPDHRRSRVNVQPAAALDEETEAAAKRSRDRAVARRILNEYASRPGSACGGNLTSEDYGSDLIDLVTGLLLLAAQLLSNAADTDEVYWSTLAVGQDSDEAEASGYLAGYCAAIGAVQQLLVHNDAATLTGYLEQARETMREQQERVDEEDPGPHFWTPDNV